LKSAFAAKKSVRNAKKSCKFSRTIVVPVTLRLAAGVLQDATNLVPSGQTKPPVPIPA
jgi:hypothetical protein